MSEAGTETRTLAAGGSGRPGTAEALRVRLAGDDDAARWDAFLDAQGGRSFACHAWTRILSASYGARPCFMLAEEPGGAIRGVLAGYLNRSLRGRRSLFSVRHGLVAADDAAFSALHGYCRDCIGNGTARSVAVTSGLRPPPAGLACEERTTVILELLDSEDATWNSLRRETRAGIKRSIKRGAEIEWGFQNLAAFYDIYAQNMMYLGAPLHRLRFFEQMAEHLGDRTGLIVVRSEGKVVAGMVVLWSADTLDLVFGAWLREFAPVVPYQRMYWEAIAEGQRRGVKLVDMGESREGSGTWTYKRNFGGQSATVYNYVLPARAGATVASGEDEEAAEGTKPGLRERLQRHLPGGMRAAILKLQASAGRII